MDWWNQIKKLFGDAEKSSPSQPLVHKVITRSEAFLVQYDRWKKTLAKRRLIDWLSNQYAIHTALPNDADEALDFLNTPSSKGFAIHFHKTNYSQEEITFLFDYFKERVLTLNYRTQISDSRTYNRPKWVESTNRHYLKPKPDFEKKEKINQQYGNIMIEMVSRDDKIYYFKFSATHYKDYLYQEAYDFKDLMQEILM